MCVCVCVCVCVCGAHMHTGVPAYVCVYSSVFMRVYNADRCAADNLCSGLLCSYLIARCLGLWYDGKYGHSVPEPAILQVTCNSRRENSHYLRL